MRREVEERGGGGRGGGGRGQWYWAASWAAHPNRQGRPIGRNLFFGTPKGPIGFPGPGQKKADVEPIGFPPLSHILKQAASRKKPDRPPTAAVDPTLSLRIHGGSVSKSTGRWARGLL